MIGKKDAKFSLHRKSTHFVFYICLYVYYGNICSFRYMKGNQLNKSTNASLARRRAAAVTATTCAGIFLHHTYNKFALIMWHMRTRICIHRHRARVTSQKRDTPENLCIFISSLRPRFRFYVYDGMYARLLCIYDIY